ncbi:EPIDERMAL PATTERNING FACTOR-like protein 9 [Elaeis guineensis]|uniref:EPIDERMAL PATTERNING FACTOR-like protein 9 n=1 Tax=Elaeis guineensis var. tenera TaxID=51953 RepID=A0A6I9RJZ8_ELAGV|nr:EPIDERMAL PATTERNING FACTOR-like protein 9 [Elaeis guineensis]
MAIKPPTTSTFFLLFFLSILLGTLGRPGSGARCSPSHSLTLKKEPQSQGSNEEGLWTWRDMSARRLMIGSTAPICTYNECRGCRFKCRAEQVPVDAGDPSNSAYHYRCICHM